MTNKTTSEGKKHISAKGNWDQNIVFHQKLQNTRICFEKSAECVDKNSVQKIGSGCWPDFQKVFRQIENVSNNNNKKNYQISNYNSLQTLQHLKQTFTNSLFFPSEGGSCTLHIKTKKNRKFFFGFDLVQYKKNTKQSDTVELTHNIHPRDWYVIKKYVMSKYFLPIHIQNGTTRCTYQKNLYVMYKYVMYKFYCIMTLRIILFTLNFTV
eukprot:TRINITY_DN3546_c1_g1_i2.p2 TRINITY_DN3546_c1_g1~~TRINITY_DN3546_c1_g1_i2.p2  ORF type:complete len:210 (+),score=0.45 TRINITY_DN3546_c1_g1_i2:79-708(+)